MKLVLYLTWIIFLNENIRLISSACPDPSVITPYGCTGCQYNYIECYGNTSIDLTEMFNKLSLTLEPEQKHFHHFKLNNTNVTELKANTFMDIVFNEIDISQTNLVHIHPDAFMYTYNITTKLSITSNALLEPDTIYDVMSKFINAYVITVEANDKLTMVPANAFHNPEQSRLDRLSFNGYITSIGSHAFSGLHSLRELYIVNSPLNHIIANTFAMDAPSNESLRIYLSADYLHETSFEPGAFTGINRPTNIYLGPQNSKSGYLTYLPENVFHPFYMENSLNTIDFRGNNELDCEDCRSYWLKKNDLLKRVLYLKCSDGKEIDAPGHFQYC